MLTLDSVYGLNEDGCSLGVGTVFAINTDGTGFTNLHNFGFAVSNGALPYGRLILSGNTLYGTTFNGGSSFNGTVFSLSLPLPQLTIVQAGANVLLTWSTNYAG